MARAGLPAARARCSATSRATREGNDIVVLDPEDRETRARRASSARASRRHDRICLADFYRPKDSGELDVVALQAVTVRRRGHRADGAAGGRRRVRRAAVRPRPRRADRRGPGRVAAREGPQRPRHRATPGPPLLVGLPGGARPVRAREGRRAARPVADRHEHVRRLRARARAVDARDRRPPPAGASTSA